MTHIEVGQLVSYVDGQLPPRDVLRVEEHLQACAECAQSVRRQRSVKRLLAAHAAAVTLPAGLGARLASSLDTLPQPRPRPVRSSTWRNGGLALSAVVFTSALGLWFHGTRPQPVDVAAIVSVHRHAYQPPAGKSYATADSSVARGWVRQQIPGPSNAPALSLPLNAIGACHVGDAPAAIWIYKAPRPVTLIEVYSAETLPEWQSAGTDGQYRHGTYGGYNAILWASGGHTFALVSDLPAEELNKVLERSP